MPERTVGPGLLKIDVQTNYLRTFIYNPARNPGPDRPANYRKMTGALGMYAEWVRAPVRRNGES